MKTNLKIIASLILLIANIVFTIIKIEQGDFLTALLMFSGVITSTACLVIAGKESADQYKGLF